MPPTEHSDDEVYANAQKDTRHHGTVSGPHSRPTLVLREIFNFHRFLWRKKMLGPRTARPFR